MMDAGTAQLIATAVITAGLTGAISSVATVAGVKVELRWLRRDVDKAHKRLDIVAQQMKLAEIKG
jgi:hypothetical protein